MKKEDYLTVQQQLRALAQIVVDMPLADFINEITRAETIGPIIDPTLYIQASNNLTKLRELAETLLLFQRTIRKFIPRPDEAKK